MTPRYSKMVAVLNTDPACSDFFCFGNCGMNCKGCDNKSKASITVNHGRRRRFMDDYRDSFCIHSFCLPEPYITRQPCYSVRIDTSQVRTEQCPGRSCGILFATAYFLKNSARKFQQVFIPKKLLHFII